MTRPPAGGRVPTRSGSPAMTRTSTGMRPAIQSTEPTRRDDCCAARGARSRSRTRARADPGVALSPRRAAVRRAVREWPRQQRRLGLAVVAHPSPVPPGRGPRRPQGNGSPAPFSCTGIFCQGPAGFCVGTPGHPCSVAEPHLFTADGEHVDFQAAGEFVVARSPDGSFQIQARQEAALGGTVVTLNTAVAANVDGDRVGIYADEPSFLVVNGRAVDAVDVAERLPQGGSLERHGGLVAITWPDRSRLTVSRDASSLNLGFVPSPAVGPSLRGLLGSANGDPTDDLTARDGAVLSLADPASTPSCTPSSATAGGSARRSRCSTIGRGRAPRRSRSSKSPAEVTVEHVRLGARHRGDRLPRRRGEIGAAPRRLPASTSG